ncbi:transactivator/viroplasm protein [Dregea volubilis virus 2]|nr:transactivator/viroplasm protein [Dregea volubilis virus 2]
MESGELTEKIVLIQAKLALKEAQAAYLRAKLHKLKLQLEKCPVNNGITSPVKEVAIPGANGSGKESTNPLKAENLLKILPTQSGVDQTTKIQELRPEGPSKKYYTIFQGPNRGVYGSWSIVSALISGKPWSFQSFKTEKEALQAFNDFEEIPERSFKQAIEERGNMQSLNRLLQKNPKPFAVVKPIQMGRKELEFFLRLAEATSSNEEKCFFTINKNSISLFGFTAKASPEMVRDCFNAGLCALIYPGSNLLELSMLPSNIQKVCKQFRKNVLKQNDAHLYIKVTSSLVDWNKDGDSLLPYYWIKIGSAKKDFEVPTPTEKPVTIFNDEKLHKLRAQRLAAVNQQYLTIHADSKIKVNYSDEHVTIISDWKEEISREDCLKIAQSEQRFNEGTLQVSEETAKLFCQYAPADHACARCPTKAKGKEVVSDTE